MFWKLTASSLAYLKAVASWSALLSFSCFVKCLLQTSDLREQRCARVGTISPLIVERMATQLLPSRRELWHHCLNSALDLPITAYSASFWKTTTSPIILAGCRAPCVPSWS